MSFLLPSPCRLRCTHKSSKTAPLADNANVSANNVIVSTDNVIVSTDNVIVSTDNAIVSTDNAIVSADNAIVSADNAIALTCKNVQRLQVIVSLVNGLALPASDSNALLTYTDSKSIPDYARKAVVSATQQKIVVNYPDPKQLVPTREATRAEVAAMVYQALVAIGRTQNINSPYIVSTPNN